MTGERAENRTLIRLEGDDRFDFLQGLVTNDVNKAKDGLVYAALLTPQGKYLADFFILEFKGALLIDVSSELSENLIKRLSMYKLRAAVSLTTADMPITRGLGPKPQGAYDDPRHPSLGWRAYGVEGDPPSIDWDDLRVAECIPESSIELIPDDSYILEAGFERLNGVDFRKGCYVGQEVTARMKHKTELKKGLAVVEISGSAPIGTPITAGEKAAGTLYTQANERAIAYLRFDRATKELRAETAVLHFKN